MATRYNARTAHIHTVGTLYNGKQEHGAGSGLLVGDRFILTNAHVVPPAENYKVLEIEVRLLSRNVSPLKGNAVYRDEDNDLALIELTETIQDSGGPKRCPMPILDETSQAPMGTQLYVLGFPLDHDLSITSGIISNQGSQGDPRWQTDTVMNAGNSGGPAFNEFGALVGIAVGGDAIWVFDGQQIPVNGVNFIIPSPLIATSPLFEKIKMIPADIGCWIKWQHTTIAASNLSKMDASIRAKNIGGKSIPDVVSVLVDEMDKASKPLVTNAPVGDLPLPATLNRSYIVSKTKDDHPVLFAPHSHVYETPLKAEPGYQIDACTWHKETGKNESDLDCKIVDDRSAAVFIVRLTSGPQYDRWRGWWGGSVTLSQSIRK